MSKTSILVVEDEAIVAADLAAKLETLGYHVAGITAAGEEAVALAQSSRPQLVLMDIQLAGAMDGIAAAEAIQRRYDVPVIYLTAHSDSPTLARAKQSGPFGYILKPFEERELAAQIELAIYKHQADRRLREQREWLQTTLNSIGDAVIATDADGCITFINPVAASLTGWPAEAAAGRSVSECFVVINEKTGECLEDPVARVVAEGRPQPLSNHAALVTRDNRRVPIEESASPIRDDDGMILGVVLVFRDVTEKRRAREILKDSEARYRALFHDTHAVMLLIDPKEGRIIDANPAACAFYGYSPETMTTLRVSDINTLPADQLRSRMDMTATTKGQHFFFQHRLADGQIRDVEVFSGPIAIDNRSLLYSIIHDITERKRAEEALRSSEIRLKQAEEIAHLGSWALERENDRLVWSDEVFRIFGLQPQAFDATYAAFLAAVHPDDREAVDDAYQRSLQDENGIYAIAHRIVRPDGTIRQVNEKCQHYRDESGQVIRSVGMIHDITEQWRTQTALERSNRELEQFAYAASHDLQEPIRAIVGFLQLLQKRYEEHLDDKGRHFIDRSVKAGHRMQQLIRDLLALSRVNTGGGSFKKTDLNWIVSHVLEDLQKTIEEKQARITCSRLPQLPVDVAQIQRLFQNLVANALKYNQSPQPQVSIGCQEMENHFLFYVKDNGIGIAPAFHERIFVVFQRLHTDREYPGTGMGLALCKKIVQRHGGTIRVESQTDDGATFYFTLPKNRGSS